MYNGIECPTCAQKRLSEERNRLLREQNRQLSRQGEEMAKQSRIAEQEQQQREHERDEMLQKIESEENEEKFHARIEELSGYAADRNLTVTLVSFQSYFFDILEETMLNEWMDTGLDCLEIEKTIKEKCLREFNELIQDLDSDDRVIVAGKYGMCFTPTFKLGLIKQIANSHSADYVIIPHQDQSLAIFPTSMVINNNLLKGYENKEVQIGEFQYMMFLQNIDEAKKIAQILSDALKRVPLIVEEVKKVVSKFIETTPKPSAAMPKKHKSVTGVIAVIIGIITGVLADYLISKIVGETGLMFFLLMAIIGGAGFAAGCFGSMSLMIGMDERAEKKISRENEKQKENENKMLFDWTTSLNDAAKDYIRNRRFDDVSGKFLAIGGKKVASE
jgi:hypothetical protein